LDLFKQIVDLRRVSFSLVCAKRAFFALKDSRKRIFYMKNQQVTEENFDAKKNDGNQCETPKAAERQNIPR
jgi:hypothetical protein